MTFANCYPVILQQIMMCKSFRPLPSLRTLIVGGCPITENFVENLASVYPNAILRSLYGATECDVVTLNYTNSDKRVNSGCVMANFELKIIGEDGKHLGPNESGEICVKSKEMFAGYYNNPEKSKEVLKDGWYHTDDYGYLDDEGFLFVIDRQINLVRYYGVKFSPLEIEELIDQIEEVVASAVVAAIEAGIEYIYAFVIKKPDSDLKSEDVVEFVNSRVSDYKHLRGGAIFIDKFPLTPSGKVKKRDLRIVAQEIHQKKGERRDFELI